MAERSWVTGETVRAAMLAACVAAGTLPLLAYSQAPRCALQKPTKVDMTVLQQNFKRYVCTQVGQARCATRWKNISPLIARLSEDPDVPTVGSEAYMLATIELELGQWDFDEQQVEQLQSDQPKPDYYPWTGRGWVQFTYADKYQRVADGLSKLDQFKDKDVNIVANKDLAKDPEIAYAILVQGMTQGWFEVYRVAADGGCGTPKHCGPAIKLGDFVNPEKTDYARARAVINANCSPKPCNDVNYEDKGFMPTPERLTHPPKGQLTGAQSALLFEPLLCKAMGKAN